MSVDIDLAKYSTFLFLLLPSIQIYYAASLDALIASLLLGVLYFLTHPHRFVSLIGSTIALFLTSFLTFGFVFVLPVIVGYEILRDRSVRKFILLVVLLSLCYSIINMNLGFNYVSAFETAAKLENPNGFRLLNEPISYLFTRLEGIFEILLFFGPYLGIPMIRGLRMSRKAGFLLTDLTWLAITSILCMFVLGTFRTGETARVCLFIYPYLMLPIIMYLSNRKVTALERNILLILVFSQTLFMQTFGTYFW